jgi:tetratricopeptide (TPR) repeat protein
MSGKTLNRLIAGLAALILLGVPTIAVVYYFDRHVDAGPSLADRQLATAEEAVRAEPNLISARLALALAYATSERRDEAIEQYGIVISAEPGNRIALLGRGDALRSSGDLDGAARDYQALVDIAGQGELAGTDRLLEAAYYGLGVIAREQGRPQDAATNLANALLINKTDADALDLLGQVLVELGDYPAAVDALEDAVALVPTGWCDPYQHLEQAYSASGDDAGAQLAEGMIALCEGRNADAEESLAGLVDGEHSRDALIGLGLAAEARGDAATAAAMYQRVYDSDPTDFAAVSGLSRVTEPGTDLQPAPADDTGAE